MVFMPVTYPMKRPIHCKCERFVDESGNDVRWSLCVWHEDRAQWAARETHLHDPAVCRQCAALPPSAPPALDAPDMETLRVDRGWPTPNSMRQAADALDMLVIPKYGDALRWVADACDTCLQEQDR